MWSIYGKKYDLTDFAERHPGGKEIIERTKDLGDCTALFESYHAFSDLSGILQSLHKYEIQPEPGTQVVPYTENNFANYRELVARIKTYHPDRSFIKAPSAWFIWTGLSGMAYLFLLKPLFLSSYLLTKCIFAVLSATVEMSLMFNVLHDSSHYAVSLSPETNTAISRIANNWGLWNHFAWLYHHVYYHHSFTGGKNDPDHKLYKRIIPYGFLPEKAENYATNFFYGVFPGQYVSQMVWYARISITNRVFNINNDEFHIPPCTFYNGLDVGIRLLKIYTFYSMGVLPTAIYLITQNTLYYVNIMADHDLHETRKSNYDGPDWAKRQICNSGNFANDNPLWTLMFGGINYQIEHHLFPNMCNQHYCDISHVVRQFCKEKRWPYSHQPTVMEAYESFMKKTKME